MNLSYGTQLCQAAEYLIQLKERQEEMITEQTVHGAGTPHGPSTHGPGSSRTQCSHASQSSDRAGTSEGCSHQQMLLVISTLDLCLCLQHRSPASPQNSLGQPCTGSQGGGEEQQGLARGSNQPYELPHAHHGCLPPLLLESTQPWECRGSHLSVGHLVQILVGHVHHEGVNAWGRERGERGELDRLGCLFWPPSPPAALWGTAPAGSCARPRGHPTAQPPLALPGQGTGVAKARQGVAGNKPFSWTMVCSSCLMWSLQRGMSTCSA